ncbi:MAG: hypothetical protein GF398_02895 [Chitinivibrionales bacterium]|nr:hypothetical protein [Chitinivibrionales bacterium]
MRGNIQYGMMTLLGTALMASVIYADLTMNNLGKNYARNTWSTDIYAEKAYRGDGVMSVRNNEAPQWKDKGYYQRSRDCGQTFTATKDCVLDAVIIRTSNSSKAVFKNAIGQPMFMQLFEITGTPTINDNGTPYGSEPAHGFGVGQKMHRCDDYFENITFTSIGVAHGATFPDIAPTYPSGTAGKLAYVRCDFTGEHEIELKSGHRYAFMLGFTNPTDFGPLYEDQCRIGISMENFASAKEPPDLTVDLTPYAGGFSIRREGDGTLPPTMIPGATPQPHLIPEAMFAAGAARYELSPTSDGYPDVDTYRDWNFYLEVKESRDDVAILDGWRKGAAHRAVDGSNRALVVAVGVESDVVPSLSGVTYGGEEMRPVITDSIIDGGNSAFIAFYVLNDTGIRRASDPAISLSWSASPTKSPAILSCLYQNVDQSTLTGETGSSSAQTTSLETGMLTNDTGDMVLASVINGSTDAGFAFHEDFSELIEATGEGSCYAVAQKIAPGTAVKSRVAVSSGNRSVLTGFVLHKAEQNITRHADEFAALRNSPVLLSARLHSGMLTIQNIPSDAAAISVHTLSGRLVATTAIIEHSNAIALELPRQRAGSILLVHLMRKSGLSGSRAESAGIRTILLLR